MSTRYVCVSTTCRREMEFEVSHGGISGRVAKVCPCGAEMKKVYAAPILRKLYEVTDKQFFADCILTGIIKSEGD